MPGAHASRGGIVPHVRGTGNVSPTYLGSPSTTPTNRMYAFPDCDATVARSAAHQRRAPTSSRPTVNVEVSAFTPRILRYTTVEKHGPLSLRAASNDSFRLGDARRYYPVIGGTSAFSFQAL